MFEKIEKILEPRRVPGYGVCIYCGSTGGELGLFDEHIVPLSLNGIYIIEKASCKNCERAIQPADTHLAKQIFWNFRLHINAKTRNPRQRPKDVPIRYQVNGILRNKRLPINVAPFCIAMPVWDIPGILREATADAPFPPFWHHIYQWVPPNIRELLEVEQNDDFKIVSMGKSDPILLARSIAKIAYCHLILECGIDSFAKMELPDIILGKANASAISYLVGCLSDVLQPPHPDEVMHFVQRTNVFSPSKDIKLSVTSIRLFANTACDNVGMPIYYVVTGAPKEQSA